MAELKYDPEFREVLEAMPRFEGFKIEDALDVRTSSEVILGAVFAKVPRPGDVTETKHEIKSLDGTKIDVWQFKPTSLHDAGPPQRAVIHIHGGGYVAASVELTSTAIASDASSSQVQIFAVGYRRAPEHPAPAALEDVFATIKWLQANAKDFNVDPSRIAVKGESAGGGLAVGAALLARDKGLNPPLARVIALYPMLDDRTVLEEGNPLHERLMWTAQHNEICWKAYLGGRERDQRADVSIYTAPGRADDLSNLPPTYVDMGGFDLFLEEDIAFVGKLAKANNQVEFHIYPGLPHGFDGIAPMIRASKEAAANRRRVLSDF